MRRGRGLLAAALLAGPSIAAPAAPELVLRHGTRVPLATVEPLSSKRAHQGQRFDLAVSAEVRVAGLLVIPKGARGVGEVSRAAPKGMMGKAGRIEVRLLFVEAGGRRIRLGGTAADRGRSGAGPVVLATPLIGLGSVLFSGTNAVIPAGSPIDGYVVDDVPLVRAGTADR